MNTKLICFIAFTLFLVGTVNAQVLVNTQVDKNELSTNEVAFLTVNIYNDTGIDIENFVFRAEVSDNLTILENDSQILLKEIGLIKQGMGKETKIKVKANSTKKEIGEMFAYYGNNMEFVSGTFVTTKESPVVIKTSISKKLFDEGEKIIVDFEIHNYSKEPLYNVAIEVSAPQGFIVETAPVIIPILEDNNSLKNQFEILVPLNASGEQTILLNYGFFDNTGVHFFEETFIENFEKGNNTLLAAIGIIVLIIAVIVYMSTAKKETKIKGTKEKAE